MKRTQLLSLLGPGESLGAVTPVILSEKVRGKPLEYAVHEIRCTDIDGNSVLYEIPGSGRTELTHVVRGINMSIRALDGRGELVVDRANGERHIHDLARGLGAVTIVPGDTYYYLNTGGFGESLLVRDDCSPAFQQGDEIELQASQIDDPKTGDYLVLRNPRHPGKGRTAGVWRVAILDYHDTWPENRRRADQAKFRPTAPHARALIQRAGEEDIYPVKVQVNEYANALEVVPHPLAADALVGRFPGFIAQADTEVYKRV